MNLSLGICFWPLRGTLTLKTGIESTYVSIKLLSNSMVSLESKSYQGIKTTHQSCMPSYTVVQQPNASPHNESSDAPSVPMRQHDAPSAAPLHQQNSSGLAPPKQHHLPPPKKRLKMHNEEGRFKPDQFPEPHLTKSCAGIIKCATPWQFKMICLCCCVLTLLLSTSYAFSLPLPCASTITYLLYPTVSQFRELSSKKFFSSLQKMVFSTCIPPWTVFLWQRWRLSSPEVLLPLRTWA